MRAFLGLAGYRPSSLEGAGNVLALVNIGHWQARLLGGVYSGCALVFGLWTILSILNGSSALCQCGARSVSEGAIPTVKFQLLPLPFRHRCHRNPNFGEEALATVALEQRKPESWSERARLSRARAAAWRSESHHSNVTVRLSTHFEIRGTTIRAASGSAAFGTAGLARYEKPRH